jgi:bifunctional DNA-binding transcriptional regulator/antitoxin component of YhaV-PrlF toxin-antitoxin module
MNAITRIAPDGGLVVPADAIAAAHLAPGTELEVEVRPDGVLLRPRQAGGRLSHDEVMARLRAMRLYDGPPKTVEEISSVPEEWLREHFAEDDPGR